VPCGIADCKTTSLEKLLERQVPLQDVKRALEGGFAEALRLEMRRADPGRWLERLEEVERAVAAPA
jgi:lipoate-protein ligase B